MVALDLEVGYLLSSRLVLGPKNLEYIYLEVYIFLVLWLLLKLASGGVSCQLEQSNHGRIKMD